jgi:hypothetical protein
MVGSFQVRVDLPIVSLWDAFAAIVVGVKLA